MRWRLLLLVVIVTAACGACRESDSASRPGTTTDSTTIDEEPTGFGSMTVTVGDRIQTLPRWWAQFDLTDKPGERDALRLVFGAQTLGYTDGVNISILREDVLRSPFSLVGTYDVSWSQSPPYSCVVEVGTAPNRVSTSLPGSGPNQSRGSVTILSHEAGRMRGTLSATLSDGRSVSAEFEGEVTGECSVPVDGSDNAYEEVTFEHPFCAKYFQ